MNSSPIRWLRKCAGRTRKEYRKNGLAGARHEMMRAWQEFFHEVNLQYIRHFGNPGESIYNRDWDVMIVLDACRVDLLQEVTDEYEFIRKIDTFHSLGSKSPDWMRRNFDSARNPETTRTAYVTGNPFSRMFDDSPFAYFDEVWRYAWDDSLNTIPARPLTDRAIDVWRQRDDWGNEDDTDRMIVHYMQPHVPFVSEPDLGTYGDPDDFGQGFEDLWQQAGYTISQKRVWQAYRDNLRYVLDDVSLLLSNLDAENVVITADHGNAVGEFGIWGHPTDVLLSSIRTVPWVETTGTDTTSYDPTLDHETETIVQDETVEERLRDLGYV